MNTKWENTNLKDILLDSISFLVNIPVLTRIYYFLLLVVLPIFYEIEHVQSLSAEYLTTSNSIDLINHIWHLFWVYHQVQWGGILEDKMGCTKNFSNLCMQDMEFEVSHIQVSSPHIRWNWISKSLTRFSSPFWICIWYPLIKPN